MSSVTSALRVSRPAGMNTASAQTAPRQGEAESRDPLAEGASARAYVELLEPHWLSAIESATD